MPLTCEICGSPIRGPTARVEIDGAVLRVCPGCARRGTPVDTVAASSGATPRPRAPGRGADSDMEVDPEYPTIVKRAREKLGLTHEQLGRMINVKPSVISHVETGKMKPDIALARTLMHQLKVNLLVKSSDLDSLA